VPAAPGDFNYMNSDFAFTGNTVIQGNFQGFSMWDTSDPAHPKLVHTEVCPEQQNDVSVYKNLLFLSGESGNGRVDCGAQGVHDPVSAQRMRGVRVLDISDVTHPRIVANVQTCRGSHTHTLVTNPKDTSVVYIYVSGQAPVRPAEELAGCSNALPDQDTASAKFRIDIIRVPVAHPEQAAIVSRPRILKRSSTGAWSHRPRLRGRCARSRLRPGCRRVRRHVPGTSHRRAVRIRGRDPRQHREDSRSDGSANRGR
jgi:hypothetical protein